MGFPGGLVVKNSPASAGDMGLIRLERFPWRRKWQPTPVLLPAKSYRQSILADYSPWGCKRAGHDLVANQQQSSIIRHTVPKSQHW